MEKPIPKITKRRQLYASNLRKSLINLINKDELEQFLSTLNYDELETLYYDWQIWARDNQIPPNSDSNWKNWLILGGRGAGKTRAGAEWVRTLVSNKLNSGNGNENVRLALIGETIADVRDIMLYGTSGIMNTNSQNSKPKYIANKRQIIWPNGTKAYLFSSLNPESLRGFQFNFAWCDEFCKWRYPEECWNMLQFALRLGENPKTLITTTPKPIKILNHIMNNNYTITDKCTTYDNKHFLPQSFIETTLSQYEGTRLGRQEIYAQILEDNVNSLWQRDIIDKYRVTNHPNLIKVIIAVDPPITSGQRANACGIICAALGEDEHGYVLSDDTIQGLNPTNWAKQVASSYHQHQANYIVAEVNQGGELVKTILKQVDANLPIKEVYARHSKQLRAEPVAMLYEQGKIHHHGYFPELEDQLCELEMGTKPRSSPDSLDALVWALTELMLNSPSAPHIRNL